MDSDEVSAPPGNPAAALPLESTHARGPQRAEIRTACRLSSEELAALALVVQHYSGAPVETLVTLDPSILGGIWIRVGDLVIDGSLRGKLEALRHHLRAQCRVMVASGFAGYRLGDRTP